MKWKHLRAAALATFAAFPVATACATPTPSAHEQGPTAECPVCKHNGDLACLCVQIAPDTPTCECAGKTYYFCSEECREDFLKHPERYATK